MHTCPHTTHTHTYIHTTTPAALKTHPHHWNEFFLHTSCWQKSSVFKVVLKQVREEACLMLWRSSVSDCRTLLRQRMLASWLCFDRRDLKETGVREGTKSSGTNKNVKNVSKVLRTCASKRREKDGREFIAGFDGLEASEAPAEVGKRGQVLTTWRLPGLHCSGFSEVSGEDTLGRQLEESCSNPALSSDVR